MALTDVSGMTQKVDEIGYVKSFAQPRTVDENLLPGLTSLVPFSGDSDAHLMEKDKISPSWRALN